jgi:nicotinamide mononucleotide (NMN) deamidase PncC
LTNQELADEVTRIIAEQELTLGTVECGVNGVVSRALFDAEDGPAALGDSLIVDDLEQAVDILDLPRAQFKRSGILSAKAARAAAREGQALLWVDICFVVWGPPPDPLGDTEEPSPIYLAFYADGQVQDLTFEYKGAENQRSAALVNQALLMLLDALP